MLGPETRDYRQILRSVLLFRRADYGKILRSVRVHGVASTARRGFLALLRRRTSSRWLAENRAFDERYGLQTSDREQLHDLTVKSASTESSEAYSPTPVNVIPDVLSRLEPDYRDFSFVDLGAGKGAVVILAAQFNFSRVVGVEFARELHEQSIQNVAQYPSDRTVCKDIALLHMDVADYEFPANNLVIFIFNAFKKELLYQIMRNIGASYRANPRKIYIVYLNPVPENDPVKAISSLEFMTARDVFSFADAIQFCLKCPYDVVVYGARR